MLIDFLKYENYLSDNLVRMTKDPMFVSLNEINVYSAILLIVRTIFIDIFEFKYLIRFFLINK